MESIADLEHRLVEQDSSGWSDWLLFRDYLSATHDAAERYATLKLELASRDRDDRVRYRAGKAPPIGELMAAARQWNDNRRISA